MNGQARTKLNKLRQKAGFGLPTIICLGVTAALVLYGSAQLLTSSMQKVAGERLIDVMRASAESGLDWAVDRLSNPLFKAALDTGAPVTIPYDYISPVPGSSLTGTVTVARVDAPSTSYLYQSTLDSTTPNTATGGQVEWRVVTATVTNGARSKSVRVILKPIYSPSTKTVVGLGTPVPYFTKSLFAPGLISFSGNNATTDSYDSAVSANPSSFKTGANGNGDVGSNTGVAVGNGNINGHATVTAGQGQGSVSVGPNGAVTTGVQTSGTASGVTSYQTLSGSAATPQFIPDAPSAPANATNIGAISKSYTFTSPGDYVVSSIALAGKSAITFPASGVVNLYVQGAGASISIAGNGLVTPSGIPSNVRIWYSGSQDVSITGNGSMRAVLFAPNADVSFKGNGEFYGAAVGKSVNITGNGIFHYDEALGRSQQLTYIPPQNISVNSWNFEKYQAVSWMEF